MIRQVLSITAPAAGTAGSDLIRGKWYGFRVAPPVSGAATGPVLVTVVRYDGATETLALNPLTDGWLYFRTPVSGVRVVSATSSVVVVDLWYSTELGELAVDREPVSRAVEVYDSGAVAAGAVINTGVLDVSNYSQIGIITWSDTAIARNLTLIYYRPDGVTQLVLGGLTIGTVTGPSIAYNELGHGSGGGASALVGLCVPNRLSLSLAAGGAGNARITVHGR